MGKPIYTILPIMCLAILLHPGILNIYMKNFGWLLLAIGVLMLLLRGINYTTKEKVVDLGPVEINKTENHSIGWPVYAGGIFTIAGVILVAAGYKRK
jgi:hypothetical protein